MLSPPIYESAARRVLRLLLPAILVAGLCTAALWWWAAAAPEGGETRRLETASAPKPSTAADAPGDTDLTRASRALDERRLLSPPGDNAVEYYLRALELAPQEHTARQALLELIPQATLVVESSIVSGDLDAAERQMSLVAKMGGSELRLNPLRAQLLDARAALAEREALAAAPAVNEPSAAPPPTRPTAVATPAAREPTRVVANVQPPAESGQTATPAAAPEPTMPATATAPAAASPTVVEPRQVTDVRPAYPNAAKQRKLEGWVELELAIGADGAVESVVVVSSDPPRVFDREAIRAAQRWRFEPRRVNGTAEAARVRKRLSFKL